MENPGVSGGSVEKPGVSGGSVKKPGVSGGSVEKPRFPGGSVEDSEEDKVRLEILSSFLHFLPCPGALHGSSL